MRSTYTPLVGGRPSASTRIDDKTFVRLIDGVCSEACSPEGRTHERVWLELSNGESLIVSFEKVRDDSDDTCTMRVRQTRVTDACTLDNPADCIDVGCVAVRWNRRTREGVLVDLFKSKKGDRLGCDISSADDPSVKWGQLMLRVVDDIAALLGCKHVYLADESSVRLRLWSERTRGPESTQVMLKYLRPLIHGVGYYEPFGYYDIPKEEYYGYRPEEGLPSSQLDASRRRAASELNDFNSVRTAPFRGGRLADALASIERGDERPKDAPPTERTLIYRFAQAVAKAQESPAAERVHAFHAAARADRDAEEIPNQSWTHSRSAVPSDPCLVDFARRHEIAIDGELLGAADLGAMIRMLRARNRASGNEDALRAGTLLTALMFDFFAVWSPRRHTPLKRKDYFDRGDVHWASACACEPESGSAAAEHAAPITLDAERHVPIVSEAYSLGSGRSG